MENTSVKELTPIRFNFYKINFTPYNDKKGESSSSIISKVLNYLASLMKDGKGFLIDKHESRISDSARPLFATSVVFMPLEKRYRGSIALLRTGKIPMLKPKEKYLLVPFDENIGEIAEQTRFYVDYSTESLILCVEFNYNGPRASDIEYYFRVIARDQLRIAKATELEVYMDVSIDKTLSELKNVLSFEIKAQPQKIAQLDAVIVGQYFSTFVNFNNLIKPKYLKIEAFFQNQGKKILPNEENKGATKMVKDLLKLFQTKKQNIEVFENFFVKYENNDGVEDFFNLLKGKKEIIKHINIKETKGRQWYELIKDDFDNFVNSL